MARPPKKLNPNESFAQHYGAKIRSYREKKGWTQDELSRKLLCDESQVSRYEHGQAVPDDKGAKILDMLFETDYFTEHREVAAVSRIPPNARELAKYESEAKSIRAFSHGAVIGLLQSPSYVRALARGGLTPQDADEIVEERDRRQGILDADPPVKLQAIMNEAVIRSLAHNPDIAREQIQKLLDRADQWNVQIQIVRLADFTHPGHQGGIHLIESRKKGSVVAWHSGVGRSGRIIDDDEVIVDLVEGYDLIRSAAMPAAESYDLLKKIQESL
ncbi:helix-turn-helix domain-containing protein [Actinomadura rayongensis]|uniref:Helix-turn-helix domain-containing protein n=1 Tax=Actinomadura rayongensis TaxID=1429076 RepID=A0A6I4WCZ7_9ACTN|nr:Scr1 family TA system antitoxin-like transcriptional regulator [Actinomadura rayongensis]MXQ67003.1 helix-turn-helix domain-containing protein [Actinomadura rayongensis]